MPRKKRDPDYPKRPLSSYMFYSKERRPLIQEEQPNLQFGDYSKIIAAEWKKMNNEQKEKYLELSKKDKVRYEEALKVYKEKKKNEPAPTMYPVEHAHQNYTTQDNIDTYKRQEMMMRQQQSQRMGFPMSHIDMIRQQQAMGLQHPYGLDYAYMPQYYNQYQPPPNQQMRQMEGVGMNANIGGTDPRSAEYAHNMRNQPQSEQVRQMAMNQQFQNQRYQMYSPQQQHFMQMQLQQRQLQQQQQQKLQQQAQQHQQQHSQQMQRQQEQRGMYQKQPEVGYGMQMGEQNMAHNRGNLPGSGGAIPTLPELKRPGEAVNTSPMGVNLNPAMAHQPQQQPQGIRLPQANEPKPLNEPSQDGALKDMSKPGENPAVPNPLKPAVAQPNNAPEWQNVEKSQFGEGLLPQGGEKPKHKPEGGEFSGVGMKPNAQDTTLKGDTHFNGIPPSNPSTNV